MDVVLFFITKLSLAFCYKTFIFAFMNAGSQGQMIVLRFAFIFQIYFYKSKLLYHFLDYYIFWIITKQIHTCICICIILYHYIISEHNMLTKT